ncbi:MAG TPA: site-specific DNA-methyltransferase [Verrucomicrobiota bacterium]|jgi:adenine-specific DNA-methyltransferase|nr:site-specific DNA-methyltransferase [Verrucomicrobiota bacterium]HQL76832.1 site-specific DNA-methyltransferase [Verrucomicrobiota bacterium]
MFNAFNIASQFNPTAQTVVFEGDCREMLREVPAGSIQLVVTSPPYNLGKEYERRLHLDDYVAQQREVIAECVRVLSKRGSICWQVGNYVEEGAIIPLDALLYPVFAALGLKMRNRIVWHFEHGLHCSRRLSGRYETIMWLTKSDDYVFEVDPIRVPQKYPGKKYFKGPKTGQYSCNPLGKNPGDVWTIPNVKCNHVEKTEHPCQFPVELVERLVLALTRESDWVLDPFLGTGTSVVAAVRHKRRGIGAEVVRKYAEIARSRIRLAAGGELPVRPMHRPVFDPKEAGRNLLTAPWLVETPSVDQMALLEKTKPYRTRK